MIGTTIAHYRITAKLGEGGMGAVYRATDTRLNRDVAIKVLPPSLAQDADYIARFQREAQVLAALNHPNIAQIYGLEEKAIVMELVEGANLEGPLPLDDALRCARQIAEALEAAHEKGIIHRDLKPANVKLTPDGTVKVLDFGLAKAPESAAANTGVNSPTLTIRSTQAGVIMGTAGYMAPEQAAGRPVDKRADIWAFGVVLYELLTGKLLFDGETISHTLADVLRADIPINQVPAPQTIRDLLGRCLDRNPKTRLRDIGEARMAIDRYLAAPPTPKESSLPARRATPWLPWTIAAATLLIATATAITLWPRPHPVPPLIQVVEEGDQSLAESIAGPSFALSPNGMWIVYTVVLPDKPSVLLRRRMDQSVTAELAGTSGAVGMFWSPDSRWIGYFTNDGMYRVSVEGGAPILICRLGDLGRGAVWGRDGNIFFAPTVRGPLSRVPASGGEPVAFTKLENGEVTHRWPTLSPKEDYLVFVAANQGASYDTASMVAQSIETGARTTILKSGSYPRWLPTGELLFTRAGTLYAVGLDQRLQATAEPRPVLRDIATLLNGGASQLTVSDTGTVAYIPGWIDDQRPNLTRIFADSRVSHLGVAERSFDPRLSPDGKRLAMHVGDLAGGDLYVRDLERGTTTRITFDGKSKMSGSVWTPDGRFLLYATGGPQYEAYSLPSDGSVPPRKILDHGIPRGFSPDGKWLLVLTNPNEISMSPAEIGADGVKLGPPVLFTKLIGGSSNPNFSPDGRWIVYSSNESGGPQVYARSFHGAGERYQISTGGGYFPVWSRTGEIFFDLQSRIMAVTCAVKGNSLHCGAPRQWSNQYLAARGGFPTFDVAPDGSVLALTAADQSKSRAPHVHFLFNFESLLR